MISNLTNMLEDIKSGTYSGYANYLGSNEIQLLLQWYNCFSSQKSKDVNHSIDLLYELYIRGNIDYKPYEEYKKIVSSLVERYHFKYSDFLNLYQQFKKITFGD